jgi:5-carboxymethyl-2-hydroxymuconate isomerase
VPHLTLEYSANLAQPLDLAGLLVELNQLVADVARIQLENFKSRAIRRDVFAVGAGMTDSGFVHLEIAIFGGRSPAIKEEIGRRSVAMLERHFSANAQGMALQITVEIRDMSQEAYFKSG